VDFVRKSVRAIGRCAIKVESSAQRCVDTLLDLIHTKVNYVVQEAIIVIKDIFRKYPNQYESIIATLCENLDTLDEPGAKAAMIWIVGEYAERIDNADELLESFLDNFTEENAQVQLQLLTAIVKLFLKRPTGTQELVQKVLGLSTQESDNPDLRDRGYIYWRLLLTDPAAAKAVVLCEKPLISEQTDLLEPSLLDELICHISSLASVFHKPPSNFVEGRVPGRRAAPIALFDEEPDLLNLGDDGAPAAASAAGEIDLLGGLSISDGVAATKEFVLPKQCWLDPDTGKGLEVHGSFARRNGQMYMEMTFANKTTQAMGDFAIQLNKNSFGLSPDAPLSVPTLAPDATHDTALPMNHLGAIQRMDPLGKLQVAIKNSVDVLYFSTEVPFHVLFSEDGSLARGEYLQMWKEMDDSEEVVSSISGVASNVEGILNRLEANNVFLIAKRKVEGKELCYMSLKFINNVTVLMELALEPGSPTAKLSIRTRIQEVVEGVQESVTAMLQTALASEA